MPARLVTVLAASALLHAGFVLPAARAQGTPPSDAFKAWFARMLAAGGDNSSLDGFKIAYRIDMLKVPPPDELEAMRAAVKDHPEHPQRRMLEMYERRLLGPDSSERILWRMDGMWRYSSGYPGGRYNDLVWGDGVAWTLNPNSHGIMDPASAAEHPYGLPGVSSSFGFDCVLMLSGGLGAIPAGSATLAPTMLDTGHWTLRAGKSEGEGAFRVEASGRWDERAGWGTVDTATTVPTTPAGGDGYIIEPSDWQYEPTLRLAMARRVRLMDGAGRPDRELIVTGTASFDRSEFRRLIALPDPAGVDPVRGKVTYRSVMDLTGSAPAVSWVQEGRLVAETGTSPVLRLEDRLRVLGWILAISALVLIGLVWVRRYRGGRSPRGSR